MTIEKELETQNENQVLELCDQVISYVTKHMLDPPGTLKTLCLDLGIAVAVLRQRRKYDAGISKK